MGHREGSGLPDMAAFTLDPGQRTMIVPVRTKAGQAVVRITNHHGEWIDIPVARDHLIGLAIKCLEVYDQTTL